MSRRKQSPQRAEPPPGRTRGAQAGPGEEGLSRSSPRAWFWLTACVALALDHLTKHIAATARIPPDGVTIVRSFLRVVRPGANPRGAFSMGPQGAAFYIVATVVGLALVGWFFLSARSARSALYIGLGCVAGGALGNLVDRVVLGGVRDFIDLHWMDKAHWPVFNVADASICLGVGLLIWETFRSGRQRAPEQARG